MFFISAHEDLFTTAQTCRTQTWGLFLTWPNMALNTSANPTWLIRVLTELVSGFHLFFALSDHKLIAWLNIFPPGLKEVCLLSEVKWFPPGWLRGYETQLGRFRYKSSNALLLTHPLFEKMLRCFGWKHPPKAYFSLKQNSLEENFQDKRRERKETGEMIKDLINERCKGHTLKLGIMRKVKSWSEQGWYSVWVRCEEEWRSEVKRKWTSAQTRHLHCDWSWKRLKLPKKT